MNKDFKERVKGAVDSVRSISGDSPEVGLILGSGLSGLAEKFVGVEISYKRIEDFPRPTVEGHRGVLKLSSKTAVMAGRFHFYEGYTMKEVVLPVFLLNGLGVKKLIVTNAAGGINQSYSPGDLVLIKDHINLLGDNPLVGSHLEMGPRFPDMTFAYSKELRNIAVKAADYDLPEGVYAAMRGPSYETPAEIRMLRFLGADMVGMSTVPEVIAARYLNMDVLGISCITNMAAGILDKPLDHSEVIETGKRAESRLTELVLKVCSILDS
ncbi:MAG: purine-nucleoside phosphorylase [Spirochaetes bacterium]|nr:MAG: purine-nucleoside phosphorylase [Spirochaetota bacterium]